MQTSSVLSALLALSQQQTDDAATRLGQAMACRSDAVDKLVMLQQVRDEYSSRLSSQARGGLSLAAYRNFQLFMEKVDQAIAGQQQIVSSAEQRTGLAQDNWQQKKRESVGYTTLIQRAVIKREKTEHKRDQKSSDEFAARAMLMRARED